MFFWMRSPSLFEDANVDEKEWEKQHYSPDYVKKQYEMTALNCWIAAGIYVVLFFFSLINQKLNSRSSYQAP